MAAVISPVIVSQSTRLAEGVCELAGQAARGRVAIAAAGGADDPANPIGADAFSMLRPSNRSMTKTECLS